MKKLFSIIILTIIAVSFAGCEKEPIIGYDPPVPQEWIDAAEEEANSPTKEVVRTYDFNGIWQLESTGKYYYIYDGDIFVLYSLDAGAGEYIEWGYTTAVQTMDKQEAETIDLNGGNELKVGDEFVQYYSSPYASFARTTTTVISENRTKTVTANGDEFVFKFIKTVDDWPEGYNTEDYGLFDE